MALNHQKGRIVGIGSYVPEKILTNRELESLVETSNEWIITRTGIEQRRIAHANEFPSDMGAKAAEIALKRAKVDPDQIDFILVATMSPDYLSPGVANLIQAKIGAPKAAACDLQAACSGFLYALLVAKSFLESGLYKKILVVAAEKMSSFIDYTDRGTCVLFGDGACAAVLAAEGVGLLIESLCVGSDGEMADLIQIPAGGSRHPATAETVERKMHFFRMSGREVFKHAVRRMTAAARTCLTQAGIEEQDICWLVPHQANKRIIDAVAKNFNLPDERIYQTLHKYGNTSASSIGIALDELCEEHSLKEGDCLLLTAFGGGLTWGAAILRTCCF